MPRVSGQCDRRPPGHRFFPALTMSDKVSTVRGADLKPYAEGKEAEMPLDIDPIQG